MDDFVSFSKEGVLVGKENKRTLKGGDHCKARIIAVSFKDLSNPKLGLTMRQPFLGKIGPDASWIEDDVKAGRGESKKDKKKKE